MKTALFKTVANFKTTFPIIIWVLLLINLVNPIISPYYSKIFSGNYILDPFVWAILWSISFGIPITSYVTWWELLKEWVSLLSVIAFILTWTTVWIIMLPLEISTLGKKFAIIRNSLNFFTAIIISIITVFILKII